MKNVIIALLITAAVVGGFLAYWKYSSKPVEITENTAPLVETQETYPQDQPLPDAETETSSTSLEEESPVSPPPSLNESDTWIVEEYKDRDAYTDRALDGEHLIRKLVTAADLIQRGENPASQLSHLKPAGDFIVEQREEKLFISPQNYARYEPAVKALERLSSDETLKNYEFLLPLFREAYDELGNDNSHWEVRAMETLDRLIEMEIPEGDFEVLDAGGIYIYANDTYEDLPPAQKIMIRIGPENARRVQARLIQLKRALYP